MAIRCIEEKAFDERCFRNEGWSLNDIIERVKKYGTFLNIAHLKSN